MTAGEERVEQLVLDLGDKDSTKRQRAYAQLSEIGPSALWSITGVNNNSNPERWQLVARLCREFQSKHGVLPVRHHGTDQSATRLIFVRDMDLEFQIKGDTVWRMPPPGGSTTIKLSFTVKNVGEKAVFFLGSFGGLRINAADGKRIPVKWSRLGGAPNGPASLAKGAIYKGEFGKVKLTGNSEPCLEVFSTCGCYSRIEWLKRGWYYVWFDCYSVGFDMKDAWGNEIKKPAHPFWIGRGGTAFLCVEVK